DAVCDAADRHVATMLSWSDTTQQDSDRAFADTIIAEMTRISGVVAQQAKALQSQSAGLAEMSERTVGQSQEAERITQGTSDNAQSVAGATEELTASLHEIARQTEDARTTAQAAEAEANRGTVAVKKLEEASGQIGETVDLITQIAAQTRLLALN